MPAKSKSKLSFQRALLCLCFFAVKITATGPAEGETSEKAQKTVGAENFADAQKILGEMQKSLTSLKDSGRHLREMADRVNTFLPSEEETQKIGHLSEEMSSLFQINPNQLPLLEKGKAKLQSAIGKLGNKEEELAELKRMIDSLQSIYKLRFDQKDQSIKLQKELDKFTDYSRIAGLIGQPAKPFESLRFEFVQNEVDWNALVLAHFSVHWIMLEPLRKRIGSAKDGVRKLIAEYQLNNPQPPIPNNREMSAGGLEEGMDNLMAKLAASRAVIKEIDGNLLPISASMEDLKRVLSNDQLNLESTNDEKEVETLMRKKEAERVEFQKIAKQKVSLQKVRDMHAKMVAEIVDMLEKVGRYVNFSRLEKKKFTDLARQFRNLRLYFWLSRWTGELHRMLVPLARAHAVNGENAIDENSKKIIATLDSRMHSFLRALGLEAAMEFELRKDAIDYGEEEKEEEHAEMTKNEEDNTVLKEVADGDGNMESKAEAEDEEEKQRKRQIQQWKMRVRMQVLKVAFAHRRLDAVFGFSAVEAPKSPTTQAEISSSSQRVQKPSPMSRWAPIESADGVSRSATELLYELVETLAALRQNGLRRKQILLH